MYMCVKEREGEKEHRSRVRATAATAHMKEGEKGTRSAMSKGTPPSQGSFWAEGWPLCRYLSYVDEAVLAGDAVGLREAAGDFDCPVVGVDARPAHGEQAAPEQHQPAQQVHTSRAATAAPPAHGPGASLPPSLACSAH